MLTTLLLLLRAAAACDVDPAAWATGVDGALAAWREHDTATFLEAEARARAEVPCLHAPVDREAAARFHLAVGLARATAGRDRAAALREFEALPPGWRPPEGLVPEGQFLSALLSEAQAAPPRARLPVALAPEETLLVDGHPAPDRPDGAALLQALRPGARVAWSALDLPPPLAPVPGPLAGGSAPAAVVPDARPRPARPLGPPLATALAGVVGGGAAALGLANRAAFDDPTATNVELVRRQRAATPYAAVAAVGASATLGFGAWWAVRW